MSAGYAQMVALAAHFKNTISQANGYPFDIGLVGIGEEALAVGSKATLPAITLTMVQDVPAGGENAGNGRIEAGSWHQSWERTIELEGKVDRTDWDKALDELLDAVRRALVSFGGVAWMSGALFQRPAEAGNTANFGMQIVLSYQADYSPP